jgi:hypothetical protein
MIATLIVVVESWWKKTRRGWDNQLVIAIHMVILAFRCGFGMAGAAFALGFRLTIP